MRRFIKEILLPFLIVIAATVVGQAILRNLYSPASIQCFKESEPLNASPVGRDMVLEQAYIGNYGGEGVANVRLSFTSGDTILAVSPPVREIAVADDFPSSGLFRRTLHIPGRSVYSIKVLAQGDEPTELSVNAGAHIPIESNKPKDSILYSQLSTAPIWHPSKKLLLIGLFLLTCYLCFWFGGVVNLFRT